MDRSAKLPADPAGDAREIFLSALEIDDDIQRMAYIDHASGGDFALRETVIELLAEQSSLGDFLERGALNEELRESTTDEATTIAGGSESLGTYIGPYRLLEPLGEGGGGTVYLAEQERPLRRRVALKVIKLGMDTKSVIARFESERQALAMMDHQNIAKILDAGTTDSGRPFFVMELVRGLRITDYCQNYKLTIDERLRLFILVAQAIQHAHQKGIIHRDIKPSNVLVTMQDEQAVPKVIDFGVAKAIEQRLTEMTLFTAHEAFIGTPAYMSPEQAELGGLDIDTRADIYALGVLLYELLVGKPPFDPAKLLASGLDECRRTIREDEPQRPSQRLSNLTVLELSETSTHRRVEPAKLAPLVQGDLDWIVMKCLEKDRRRRYTTANDLLLDVQRYLNREVVLARPPSVVYRVQKMVRRNRLSFLAASAVFLALLGGIIVSAAMTVRARRAEREATESQAQQRQLREEAEAERALAVASAARAHRNEYVSDMNVAYQALQDGNFGRAVQLVQKHRPVPGIDDLRGFEWRYLLARCQGDAHRAYPNQEGVIQCLAVSKDDRYLAVGLPEEIRLWDLRLETLVISIRRGATSLAFSPDGRFLYAASRGSLRVWETLSWAEQTFGGILADTLALSSRGDRLATASREGVRVWEPGSWKELTNLIGASSPVAFAPNGETLATDSRDGISVWHLPDGDRLRLLDDSMELFRTSNQRPADMVFSVTGDVLYAPRNERSQNGVFNISRWSVETGKALDSLPDTPGLYVHTGFLASLAMSPSGDALVTGSWDHSVGIWDLESGRLTTLLRGHRNEVHAVAISASGETIFTGGKDGSLNLWATRRPPERDLVTGEWVPLEFTANGDQLGLLDPAKDRVAIMDVDQGAILREWPDPAGRDKGQRTAIALSPDMKTLAEGWTDGSITLRSSDSNESRAFQADAAAITQLTFSPDSKSVISGNRLRLLRWYALELPKDEAILTMSGVRAQFSSDGSTLAVHQRGDMVEIWDAAKREKRRSFKLVPGGNITESAISSDGKFLAVPSNPADLDNAIRLWDMETGERLGDFIGHKESIRSVAFAPGSETLATTSSDGTLKFWNRATLQELFSIRKIGATLRELRFSPNGEWLVAVNARPFRRSGELHLYRAPYP